MYIFIFFLKKKKNTIAKKYNFNVVSILGQGSLLGVKYGDTVKPLTATHFPCKYK